MPLPKNPGIDQGILEIRLTPQALLMPASKEIAADALPGGAWVYRTPRKVIRTGINGSIPGEIGNIIGIIEVSSPDMI